MTGEAFPWRGKSFPFAGSCCSAPTWREWDREKFSARSLQFPPLVQPCGCSLNQLHA